MVQLIIFQIKASDDVILQHITLSQFYTTVKICYAFSVRSNVKKFQNLSDKNILLHQDNMSVCLIPTYSPLLHSNTGVYRGIHYFLIFALKHIVGTR